MISNAAFPWLTVLIALAAVAALVLWLVKPLHKMARHYALGISVAIFVLFAVAFATGYHADQISLYESYRWIPQIGVSWTVGINGLQAVMIFLATFLVPVVILAAYDEANEEDSYGFFAWVLALEAIMIGLFAVQDLFVFYVLFEALVVPMYFLIGRYGGHNRKGAAMKFLVYSLVGGLIMLAGVIGVYAYGPGGDHAYLYSSLAKGLSASDTAQLWLFASFFIAFAIKAPMWPFHTWLPDTAAAATPGTSTLLVSVLDKLGTYGMIVICVPLFPKAALGLAVTIIVLALISIFWGALMAVKSDNLLRLVAYTSVSHFGFMVMAIFSGSTLAMKGAMVYMVAHGISTAGMFLVVGFLARRGGSYRISSYGGWQRVTPLIAGSFLIAGLATIALPGLSGFIPEYMTLMGTFQTVKWAALVAVPAVVIAAVYVLLPYQRAFTGPKPEVEATDMHGAETVATGLILAAMLWLGFYPAPVIDLVSTPAANTVAVMAQAGSSENVVLEGSNK
ncbi:NADH-quinone oxidoreductase subunit M [Arcanobacterium wilhelmae]|uniref:NADH-quinone oxidoreductase subunit M n=1 Tax=Arcanobacterium wilhelmae TaxID=1803177 RepID=A0ABT9NA31_9ACTO|nr:NADH-quinone oxidoreductase subunit M [Arcanobacterium wilhelmae]MDP9800546.1 NADH-quinone oxidoreductase subunit M [Arcanobacterium wilhelmae]